MSRLVLRHVRRLVLASAVLAALSAMHAAGAGASSPDDLRGHGDRICQSTGKPLVKPDGSILTPAYGCLSSASKGVLVQLDPGGQVDPGFSDGGVLPIDLEDGLRALLAAGQHDAVLVNGRRLVGVTGDGSPMTGFGQNGVVDLTAEFAVGGMTAAAAQPDGRIVVAGRGGAGTLKLMRFSSDGQPDQQFGIGGTVNHPVPAGTGGVEAPSALGFDDWGRLIGFGSVGGSELGAFRLLPDGAPDPAFGPDGNGFSNGDFRPGVGYISGLAPEVSVYADGSFRGLGTDSKGLYQYDNVGFDFDEDGVPAAESVNLLGGGSGVFAPAPGGDIFSTDSPGRGMDVSFNLTRKNRAGADVWGPYATLYELSPFAGNVSAVTYSGVDDSVIAAGTLYGIECDPGCAQRAFPVIAKVDATTGSLDPAFGKGGATMIPGNLCVNGSATEAGTGGPWTRCVLDAPKVRTKIRFKKGTGRRPSLTGTATLAGAQDLPGKQTRTLAVKLPSRLKLRPGRAARLVTGGVDGVNSIDTDLWYRDRTIFIRYKPFWQQGDFGDVPPSGNHPVRIRFGLRPGVIKPLPRKLRRKPLNFRVTGAFSDSGYLSGVTWFAPGKSTKTLKIKANRIKKQGKKK